MVPLAEKLAAAASGSPASAPSIELDRNIFRLLVETVGEYAIFVLDKDGRVASWNPGAERINGYRADEIIGRGFDTFYTEEDRRRGHPAFELKEAVAHGAYVEEGWRVRKGGAHFWASVAITALRDDRGALVGFAKVTRDLTERRSAEETALRLGEETAARRTMEKLQQVTAAVSHALLPEAAAGVLMDEALAAVGATRAVCYGYEATPDALVLIAHRNSAAERLDAYARIPMRAALPGTDCLRRREALYFESAAQLQQTYPALADRITAGGTRGMVCLPLAIQEHRVGVLTLTFAEETGFSPEQRTYLSALADISAQALARAFALERERRQAERDTFLSETSKTLASSIDYTETLQAIAKLAVPRLADWCAVDMANAEGKPGKRLAVAHVDPNKIAVAHTIYERYPPEPDGASGVAHILRTGKSELYEEISEALLEARSVDAEHFRLLRSLGLRSGIAVPLPARGRVAGVLTLISAESGRLYTQEDLEFAEELGRRAGAAIENAELYLEAKRAVAFRDEFLAVASHDLRTPLSTLRLQVQAMLHGKDLSADDRETKRLRRIDQEVTRLSSLVDKLLDVSRINLGGLVLEVEPVALDGLVREVVERFEEPLRRAGSSVELSIEPDVSGQWDRLRVDQVITNLLSNAVKYGAGKPVRVILERREGRARLTVEDRGIGIDAADHERVFHKFERAVSSRYYGGVGIGLWICKQIATAHGGDIRVTSRPGEGATFVVELPL